jgi:NAD(P)H-hydrate epimerase
MVSLIESLPALPVRPVDGHKGTFGRVLIIAGSRGMSGAACLAGQLPEGILPIVAGYEPSYLTIPLPEDSEGRIKGGYEDVLQKHADSADVIALGPGLGQSEELAGLVAWLFTSVPKYLVLDADALNLLAKHPDVLARKPQTETGSVPRILTPHPGEFSRLTGKPMDEIAKDRETLAVEFAERNEVVLVLKGRHTLITDGQKLAKNTSGNSGLATGGTGDVLTGLIAALLGQGLSAFDAAHLGAYMHGVAADLAAHDLSEAGMISSDLPFYVARAWKQLGG